MENCFFPYKFISLRAFWFSGTPYCRCFIYINFIHDENIIKQYEIRNVQELFGASCWGSSSTWSFHRRSSIFILTCRISLWWSRSLHLFIRVLIHISFCDLILRIVITQLIIHTILTYTLIWLDTCIIAFMDGLNAPYSFWKIITRLKTGL